MSTELRRVPTDFKWPLNKVWKGYINPYEDEAKVCEVCNGTGSSKEYQYLVDQWYGNQPFKPEFRGSKPYTPDMSRIRCLAIHKTRTNSEFYGSGEAAVEKEAIRLCGFYNNAWSHHLNQADVNVLIEADRLWDFTRVPRTPYQRNYVKRRQRTGRCNSWLPFSNGYRPTAKEVNDWSLRAFGHDSINCSYVVEAECTRQGYQTTCSHCHGEGSLWPSKEVKQAWENWKNEELPTGEGYQIWETVSEGSPRSPVFSTPQGLAKWMSIHYAKDGTEEQWIKFINEEGWSPTMIMNEGTGQSYTGAQIVDLARVEQEMRMSLLDEAAVLGLPLLNSRKRMRKWVRQSRVQEQRERQEAQEEREAA